MAAIPTPAHKQGNAARAVQPLVDSTRPKPWGEPRSLGGTLPPVQPLISEMLPDLLKALIRDTAERMQVPPDLPAAAAVLTLAGITGRRATIQPKLNDDSWKVVPNLWGAVVAPPGYMKTPVFQYIAKPIKELQAEYDRAFHSKKANLSSTGRTRTRFVTNDATFEKLHEILSENPAGVLLSRDEIAGWLAMLDRGGREGERQFFLEGWDGSTEFQMDRVGRGSVYVPACCISLMGGIQPDLLRAYLAKAHESLSGNDGLFQRLQILVWPDYPKKYEYVDRTPDKAAYDRWKSALRTIAALNPANPVRLRFCPAAQDLFVNWLEQLEIKMRQDGLHPSVCAHLAKYRSLMPTLAGLFELVDRVGIAGSGGVGAGSVLTISEEHAMQAWYWCDYLKSHALRVYSTLSPNLHKSKSLADRIVNGQIGKNGVSCLRDIYQRDWKGLATPDDARIAVKELIDAGWLRRVVSPTSSAVGGRPSEQYEVNPKVSAGKVGCE